MGYESGITASGWPAWLNAAALLMASWVAITALSFQIRSDTEMVAVAFPLWWGTQQAFAAAASANAAIVRTTAIPAVLVVRPDKPTGLAQLREAGAWFAIDPQAIAGCLKF